MIWKCSTYSFDTKTPIIMGVLNVTPDSFSDGGDYAELEAAVVRAREMRDQGASIIDVGGESTRPGATEVDPADEWGRIAPVVEALVAEGMCVSVDTRHVEVARRALEVGASVINDISGFTDPAMVELAASSEAGLVVMHMKGEPATMQDDTTYVDVVTEVCDFLRERCEALEAAGVSRDRICIDPGPGFGKTPKQSIELMRNLHELVHLGYPVMCAASRKSYVAYAYRIEDADPKARDVASAAEALLACELGASVVRTHNIPKTVEGLSDLRPYVLLGLGSNVAIMAEKHELREAKIAQINYAIGQLCMLPDSQIIDIASFYASAPAYYEDQDEFVNTVVLMRTGIPPLELLDHLHGIENMLGRVRERENGPRTIDLDILDYQTYTYANERLVLPHPRVNERDFVVKPLLEILPNHVLSDGTPVGIVAEADRLGAAFRIS